MNRRTALGAIAASPLVPLISSEPVAAEEPSAKPRRRPSANDIACVAQQLLPSLMSLSIDEAVSKSLDCAEAFLVEVERRRSAKE